MPSVIQMLRGILAAHVKPFSSNAPLFLGLREDAALAAHHAAAKALGHPHTTLHQHRHSYAVMQLKAGRDHQWLKNQLGHAPQSTLLYTTYGLYIGAAKLTAGQQARMGVPRNSATTSATSAKAVSRAGPGKQRKSL